MYYNNFPTDTSVMMYKNREGGGGGREDNNILKKLSYFKRTARLLSAENILMHNSTNK